MKYQEHLKVYTCPTLRVLPLEMAVGMCSSLNLGNEDYGEENEGEW